MGAESTYYRARRVSETERKKLYEGGIRSEFLGHLIDMEGRPSGNGYNDRLVALPPRRRLKYR